MPRNSGYLWQTDQSNEMLLATNVACFSSLFWYKTACFQVMSSLRILVVVLIFVMQCVTMAADAAYCVSAHFDL